MLQAGRIGAIGKTFAVVVEKFELSATARQRE
jgi:hypothetical protein